MFDGKTDFKSLLIKAILHQIGENIPEEIQKILDKLPDGEVTTEEVVDALLRIEGESLESQTQLIFIIECLKQSILTFLSDSLIKSMEGESSEESSQGKAKVISFKNNPEKMVDEWTKKILGDPQSHWPLSLSKLGFLSDPFVTCLSPETHSLQDLVDLAHEKEKDGQKETGAFGFSIFRSLKRNYAFITDKNTTDLLEIKLLKSILTDLAVTQEIIADVINSWDGSVETFSSHLLFREDTENYSLLIYPFQLCIYMGIDECEKTIKEGRRSRRCKDNSKKNTFAEEKMGLASEFNDLEAMDKLSVILGDSNFGDFSQFGFAKKAKEVIKELPEILSKLYVLPFWEPFLKVHLQFAFFFAILLFFAKISRVFPL